jgi:ketosteroid isomerase-like protein
MLFNGDATLTNAALEHGGKEVNGRDNILQFWVQYKQELGNARSKFHHVTTSENAAGLFWTTEGTGPDGQPLRYHGATLLEFDEMGLIKFFRGYYDTRELKVQAAPETS